MCLYVYVYVQAWTYSSWRRFSPPDFCSTQFSQSLFSRTLKLLGWSSFPSFPSSYSVLPSSFRQSPEMSIPQEHFCFNFIDYNSIISYTLRICRLSVFLTSFSSESFDTKIWLERNATYFHLLYLWTALLIYKLNYSLHNGQSSS